jgi:hypothetical protein
MNRKQITAAVLALAIVCYAGAATAQTTRIDFTGIGQPTAVVDPGSVSVTPSGNVFARGLVVSAVFQYDIPELGFADMIITFNADYRPPDLTGHIWGTWTMATADGSIWDGSYSGQRERVASDHWILEFKDVGRCISGPQTRTQIRCAEQIHEFQPLFGPWLAQPVGYLMVPGGE